MSLSLFTQSICFFGAGSMAEAIVRGLLEQSKADPLRVSMLNRSNPNRLRELTARYGIQTASDGAAKQDLLHSADIIVLTMKPKDAEAGLAELAPHLREEQLIISVIAGLSIATIGRLLGRSGLSIARTMPNTSSMIGLGASGISFSTDVDNDRKELAIRMFEACGIVAAVDEPLLDIVTGLSGSGPAYVYYMMEAMSLAGIAGGLTAETAHELTVQTFLGAAQMVKVTGEDPAELRRKVTSPNGTTQAAIETLDTHRFSEGVRAAVHRSAERAKELGEQIAGGAKQ